jgi:hypothetical protein
MPHWVREAADEYLKRLGPTLKTSFVEIEPDLSSPWTSGAPS